MPSTRLLALLLVLTCLPASAADHSVVWSKYTANLKLVSFDEQESTAVFKGKEILRGRLFFEFDTDGKAPADGINFATLVPDAATASKLPYVVSGFYPGKIKKIFIANRSAALTMLIGEKEANRLSNGKKPIISFDVEIKINKFIVSIECDSREYVVDAVSITRPNIQLAGIVDADHFGC